MDSRESTTRGADDREEHTPIEPSADSPPDNPDETRPTNPSESQNAHPQTASPITSPPTRTGFRKARRLRKWATRVFFVALLSGNLYFLVIAPEKGWLVMNPLGTPLKVLRPSPTNLPNGADLIVERRTLDVELSAALEVISSAPVMIYRMLHGPRLRTAEVTLERSQGDQVVEKHVLLDHRSVTDNDHLIVFSLQADPETKGRWNCQFSVTVGSRPESGAIGPFVSKGNRFSTKRFLDIPDPEVDSVPVTRTFFGTRTATNANESEELEFWSTSWNGGETSLRVVGRFEFEKSKPN